LENAPAILLGLRGDAYRELRGELPNQGDSVLLVTHASRVPDLVAELTKTEVAKPKRTKKDDKAAAELSSLRAVKKDEAEQLVAAGIKSIADLAYCDIDKVAKKTGIKEDRITAMVKAALKKV